MITLLLVSPVQAQSFDLIIPNEELSIGGTLLIPESGIKAPLVIMSSGSGAQDRNETIMNFEIFRIMAEDLAEKGIPSFRYDDRETGASTGLFSEATLDLLADDVKAIVSYFENDDQYPFDEFILLGHSQGGIVGIKAARELSSVSHLILMASPVVQLKDVISEQVVIMQKAAGKSEEEINSLIAFQEKVYEAVRTDEGWDSLKSDYRRILEAEIAKLPPAAQASVTNMEAFTEAQFSRQIKPMRSPQMRSLLHYDPEEDLSALSIPVLALFGGKDTQVTREQNETELNRICRENDLNCTVRVLEEANHLFQDANTGFVTEYGSLPKAFVNNFLINISDWILAN